MWVNNLKAARRGEFGKAQEKLESGDEAETLVTLKSHIVRLEEERETLYEHLNDLQSKLQRAKKVLIATRQVVLAFTHTSPEECSAGQHLDALPPSASATRGGSNNGRRSL